MVAGNIPKVLGNDPFQALKARASVCCCSMGGSLRAEARRGLQEPRKGHHLEPTMARV